MKIRASFTGSALRESALNAQRSNRSAADPAAVRGATRSPMSAQCEHLCELGFFICCLNR
jgi:hypothetical protein